MLKTLLNAGFSGNNEPIPTFAQSLVQHGINPATISMNKTWGNNPFLKVGKLTPQSTRSEASSSKSRWDKALLCFNFFAEDRKRLCSKNQAKPAYADFAWVAPDFSLWSLSDFCRRLNN
ncbi:hypothetical protein PQG02_26300 [Nostoc sp. UHCC 0926]|uniref:hypothetical protein n=1 Tax=Nostoc sp. UHCC 0926 TaxID=3025190 RepID=UPI00235FDACE|nr:hypothetical protein [Nostoc sp. UHCC 0926]WDD32146.1 hypothetical protein PQG02_26300 [Nostoc sp. UHCC 0926]